MHICLCYSSCVSVTPLLTWGLIHQNDDTDEILDEAAYCFNFDWMNFFTFSTLMFMLLLVLVLALVFVLLLVLVLAFVLPYLLQQ